MEKTEATACDKYALEYDKWFDKHNFAFLSELNALKKVLPEIGSGIEIGIGTGKFAVNLGIKVGIEPSEAMAAIARSRGIKVINACAENIPFEPDKFDFALIITAICFVKDPVRVLREVNSILKPGGNLILSIIDRESPVGKIYEAKKSDMFYKSAHFYSTSEIRELLEQNAFEIQQICQTIFSNPQAMKETDPVLDGYGEGAFIVINSN